jgi:hypothetical protein
MMDGMRVASDSLPLQPFAPSMRTMRSTRSALVRERRPGHTTHLIQRRVHRPTGKRISIPMMDIETWDEFGMLIGDRPYFDPLAFLTSSA